MLKTKTIIIAVAATAAALALTAGRLMASSENTDSYDFKCNVRYKVEPKIKGDVIIGHGDSARFHAYAQKAQENAWGELTTSEVIRKTGEFLKGTQYVAFTLDGNDDEHLVVNLNGLDCLTFVETTLALTACVKNDELSISEFMNELCRIRYRHGVMDGYASRLHYLSDWIRDCQYKGIVKDITREIKGCERIKMSIDYMSTHPDRYTQLKKGGIDLERIKAIEEDLSEAEHWYIPKSKVNNETYKHLQTGDIICWVTDAKGLDYGHVGFVYMDGNGIAHLMHASMSIGHVLIDSRPLAGYLSNKEHFIGMSVLRPR